MVIGNDVVDLRDPDNTIFHRTEAYARKSCTRTERAWIFTQANPLFAYWWIWTLKESAYKALQQLQFPRFNSARRIACSVELPYQSAIIRYQDEVFFGTSQTSDDYVHSTVVSEPGINVHSQVIHTDGLFDLLSDSDWTLEKQHNGIPYLKNSRTRQVASCSKSHDGKWQALAWRETSLYC